MRIGGRPLSERVLIVAEIGNNHEGKIDNAREMVRRAAEAGVDAVKFQTFQTKLFTSNADPARFARLKSFELSYKEFEELERLARSLGLLFISTPLDIESARFLEPLVDAFKIASGDNDFWPLLECVARTEKPMIVSTGMTGLEDVTRTRDFLFERRRTRSSLAFLHCVSSYPAPAEQVNLAAMPLLSETVSCPVGYSDHTLGVEACLGAVALGARIIEKHFTLDKHFSDFRDHQLSADPAEMRRLIEGIRRLEAMLGSRAKVIQPAEEPVVAVARRSICAGRSIRRGERVRLEDLVWLRPGNGLRPGHEAELVGKLAVRDLQFGEALAGRDVE